MSSVSNALYFLTLPLVSVMCVIYRKIRHARYLYIKWNAEKFWGARYTLGARYLSKSTVISNLFPPASCLISFPSGTPHDISVVDGRYSMPMFSTATYHVGEDPQNCPVPLWWPKVKTRADGRLRWNEFDPRIVQPVAHSLYRLSYPAHEFWSVIQGDSLARSPKLLSIKIMSILIIQGDSLARSPKLLSIKIMSILIIQGDSLARSPKPLSIKIMSILIIQSDSLARGPKLLSIKNYVNPYYTG